MTATLNVFNETIDPYTLSETMATLFDENSVDCTFAIHQPNTNDVQQIHAHRQLLVGFSERFAEMFAYQIDKSVPFTVSHVSFASLREFVRFFYGDKIKLSTCNAGEILRLAAEYDVKKVLESCVAFAQKHLSIDNVVDTSNISFWYNISSLQDECTQFFVMHAMGVLQSPTFLRCNVEMLLYLLKNYPLICESAFLIDRCIDWAKQQCLTKNLDCTMENVRAELSDCFEYMPFNQLNHQQFIVRYENWPGLFTLAEVAPIMWNLLKTTKPRSIYNSGKPNIDFEFKPFNQHSNAAHRLRFKLNKSAILKAISISPSYVNGRSLSFLANFTISKGDQSLKFRHRFPNNCSMYTFPQAICMDGDIIYEIQVNRYIAPNEEMFAHLFERRCVDGLEVIPINIGAMDECMQSTITSISALSFIDSETEAISHFD